VSAYPTTRCCCTNAAATRGKDEATSSSDTSPCTLIARNLNLTYSRNGNEPSPENIPKKILENLGKILSEIGCQKFTDRVRFGRRIKG
jgi:hypothetical protein